MSNHQDYKGLLNPDQLQDLQREQRAYMGFEMARLHARAQAEKRHREHTLAMLESFMQAATGEAAPHAAATVDRVALPGGKQPGF
jgi:hypothetical protein